MKLVGREKLFELGMNKRLNSWLAEIKEANWKIPDEIKAQYPRMIQVETNKFLYPVLGGKVHIELLIAFPKGIVLIKNIVRVDE